MFSLVDILLISYRHQADITDDVVCKFSVFRA